MPDRALIVFRRKERTDWLQTTNPVDNCQLIPFYAVRYGVS
jgi:hypothetical protein